MYQLISITRHGEAIDIKKLDVFYIGKDYVIASFKGYGFRKLYSLADSYIVVTKKI